MTDHVAVLDSQDRSANGKCRPQAASGDRLLWSSWFETHQSKADFLLVSVAHSSFAVHFTSSISLGRQVLSIQGCSGPYMRSMANQLLPGTVANQLPSLPCGALGAK